MELRTYEGMFMLDPTKVSQEWDNIKKQIIGMVERRGGVIISARKWGERKLAYEINGHKRASYLLIYFQAPPTNISTLKRDLQLSEIVMRTLFLVHTQSSAKEQQEKMLKEQELEQQEVNEKLQTESKEAPQANPANPAKLEKPEEQGGLKSQENPKPE